MTRGTLFIALLCAVALPAAAQNIPPAIQQELNRRSMTEAEARAMAQQLGIDLADPIQATQRARELGVPESTIQEMLRAIRQNEVQATDAGTVTGTTPVDPLIPAREAPPLDTIDPAPTTESEADTPTDAPTAVEYFGYALFENIPDAFQPTAIGPVDDAYIVGPGDELRLTVWGASEFAYTLTVDAEGRIFVPNVGQFLASGRRLSTLRNDLRQFLSRSYAGLTTEPPTISMDLTVTRLRPVQVYVLGEVARPGGYTVSASSSGFNVLYATGGPLTRGSLRSIEIIRGGRRVGGLDLYNYLLRGYERNPVRLQTNDFVFVPPRGKTVSISGAVRRPAIFELVGDETFGDLLDFAGGLLADAYTKRFQIERIVPFEERDDPSIARQVLDLSLSEVLSGSTSIALRDGDIVRVGSITDRLDNAVAVEGAVFQPGQYELAAPIITVRDLIHAADGLTETAYREQATLIRLREDFTEEQVTLNLQRVLDDDPLHNLPLRQRDVLRVEDRSEVQSEGQVTVSGQVRNQEPQPFRQGMTLGDALFEAGGLQDSLFVKDVFLARADLYRRDGSRERQVIIPFNLGEVLGGGGAAQMELLPGDQIRIYPREVERLEGDQVQVTGAVRAPGPVTYREGLTVEDALLQAGGLTQFAFLEVVRVSRPDPDPNMLAQVFEVPLTGLTRAEDGRIEPLAVQGMLAERSFLLRPGDQVTVVTDPNYRPLATVSISGEVAFPGSYPIEDNGETIGSVVRRAGGVLDTGYLGGASLVRAGVSVAVDLERALASPRADMRVLPGDQIVILRRPNTVQVTGNVNREALIRYAPGKRVSYYLDRAGGKSGESEAVFITQADGATFRLRGGLFPANPRVTEGAVINVTQKAPQEPEERTDVGRIITETLSVVSAALTAIILATRL